MKSYLIFLTLGLLANAYAEDIQIEMTGNIYANTCTVNLGQAVAGNFKDVGDTGKWIAFDLTLSKCPSTTTLATATFLGQADGAHPSKFANIGTAGGLALELADRPDKMLIAPQASFSVLVNQDDHTADFPLSARYYATALPVTAGTFSSVVQVTFIYQ